MMRPQRNDDYQPGALVRAWHKQETGGMQISEIVKSRPVREILGRAASLFRPRRPHAVKLQQIEPPRTEEIDLANEELKDMLAQTVQMRAIRRPALPRDEYGSPYLAKQSDEPNERLIPSAVAEYYRAAGFYPSIIELRLDRYLDVGAQQYYEVNGKRIPYEAGWDDYDIKLTR